MKVLIVEDDTMERKALIKLFEMCYGDLFSVIAAYDGASAVDRLARYHFDLVLLDIVLPDMSGLDVLETMRERKNPARVIMATACSDYNHLRKSMRGHAIDYLIKPYSVETFRDAIDGFLTQYGDGEEFFGSKKVVLTIRQYIDRHYHTTIKLDELASLVSLDKSYIEKLFKKECGMNIFAYVLEVRMKNAKRLLAKGLSVAETSSRVGFDDPAYFGKCFKSFFGVTPQYFKSH